MRRTNIFLTEEQQKRLDRRAREEGVSKSKIVRRILDEGLDITKPSTSVEEAIQQSSGLWADREAADLDGVMAWRREVPLERLQR